MKIRTIGALVFALPIVVAPVVSAQMMGGGTEMKGGEMGMMKGMDRDQMMHEMMGMMRTMMKRMEGMTQDQQMKREMGDMMKQMDEMMKQHEAMMKGPGMMQKGSPK
ncbi:MAG: hypothetical protein ACOYXR_05940 [Nitrospirota bacterium]